MDLIHSQHQYLRIDLSSTTTAVASKDADNVIVLDPDDIKTISVDDTLYSYTLTQTDDKWLKMMMKNFR